MHVMRQWSHIIEKLGIDWPPLILLPKAGTNELSFQFINGIFQKKLMRAAIFLVYDGAEPFILTGQRSIFGRSGRRKPTFIDPSTCSPQHVIIVGMKLYPTARHTE